MQLTYRVARLILDELEYALSDLVQASGHIANAQRIINELDNEPHPTLVQADEREVVKNVLARIRTVRGALEDRALA